MWSMEKILKMILRSSYYRSYSSVTFMTGDGIIPSNEGRGYVLRRLLRRAARHGRLLNIEDKFLTSLSTIVIEESKDAYPDLEDRKEYILKLISIEEDNFNKTIDQGLGILEEFESKLLAEDNTILAGEDAFKLYDTYGFPLDLTKEILEEKGMSVDEEVSRLLWRFKGKQQEKLVVLLIYGIKRDCLLAIRSSST